MYVPDFAFIIRYFAYKEDKENSCGMKLDLFCVLLESKSL